jgi:glycosyltransferase involved in cell wall biosynthesis
LAQSLPPVEILIGDDSSDERTSDLVHDYIRRDSDRAITQYFRNSPSLGQARNVDALFQRASGDLIALLHDDDWFCVGAFQLLAACFTSPKIAAAYGRQLIADADGSVDESRSHGLNQAFFRTEEYAGEQPDFFEAALLQQFPNDGFLIRSEIAKAVRYTQAEELMGDACDFGFALLCAKNFPNMTTCFADVFTAVYRESTTSVTRSNSATDAGYRAFSYVSHMNSGITSRPRVHKWLENKAPVAIAEAANLGLKRDALQMFTSKWHRSKVLTPGGLKRALQLALPTPRTHRN